MSSCTQDAKRDHWRLTPGQQPSRFASHRNAASCAHGHGSCAGHRVPPSRTDTKGHAKLSYIHLVGDAIKVLLPVPCSAQDIFKDLLQSSLEASHFTRRSLTVHADNDLARAAGPSDASLCPLVSSLYTRAIQLGLKASYVRTHCPGGDVMLCEVLHAWLAAFYSVERVWAAHSPQYSAAGLTDRPVTHLRPRARSPAAKDDIIGDKEQRMRRDRRLQRQRAVHRDLVALRDVSRFIIDVLKVLQLDGGPKSSPPAYPDVLGHLDRTSPTRDSLAIGTKLSMTPDDPSQDGQRKKARLESFLPCTPSCEPASPTDATERNIKREESPIDLSHPGSQSIAPVLVSLPPGAS
ncbi:unnamed protein product [Parajaminaea phylloscopi]